MSTTRDPAAVVTDFYAALSRGEADAAAELVVEHFNDDATLSRPESLPGGGVIEGAAGIARFMRAAASQVRGLQLRETHVAPGDGTVHVFAVLELSLGATTSAIEWWVFDSGGARSVTAYYWDTSALMGR
ncbi:nuclear transport factor 2 family protein [Mycobacterium sherrisii]|uniref:nuclear transport factor 2 family protein n=1 Tax=Mycobacterium sherrisii TaxID=243061 RepID=UPI001301F559|nr:nuclear transport factor 2 family protein [Mycobacterium sherrisii]MCV7032529.1 nuclear transport factor 2 family protein [Mycobacterium sherrisii]